MVDDELWSGDSSITSPLGEVRKGFLRYYLIFSTYKTFSDTHKKRLADAISEIEGNDELILEDIEYKGSHALLSLGISTNAAPQTLIDEILISTNGFDSFLRFHFFLTNTHKPNDEEIAEYLAGIA